MSAPPTAFHALRDALIEALSAAPGLDRVKVDRWTDKAQSAQIDRVVLVKLEGSDEIQAPVGCRDWLTLLSIQLGARPTPARPDAEEAAGELLQIVWSVIGDLVLTDVIEVRTDPRIDFSADSLDATYSGATLRIGVTHRTPANSLQSWSA